MTLYLGHPFQDRRTSVPLQSRPHSEHDAPLSDDVVVVVVSTRRDLTGSGRRPPWNRCGDTPGAMIVKTLDGGICC